MRRLYTFIFTHREAFTDEIISRKMSFKATSQANALKQFKDYCEYQEFNEVKLIRVYGDGVA